MKARKVSLAEYMVKLKDGKDIPYNVRESLAELLCHPGRRLNGSKLLKQNLLAERILTEPGQEVLLTEEEYASLKEAAETFEGFTRTEVELVRRVMDAAEVEVQEKEGT